MPREQPGRRDLRLLGEAYAAWEAGQGSDPPLELVDAIMKLHPDPREALARALASILELNETVTSPGEEVGLERAG